MTFPKKASGRSTLGLKNDFLKRSVKKYIIDFFYSQTQKKMGWGYGGQGEMGVVRVRWCQMNDSSLA